MQTRPPSGVVTEAMLLAVYHQEAERVLNVLARRVGRAAAPELRDQALMEFFAWWPAHPEHPNPTAALYMITQRRAVDHLGKQGRILPVQDSDLDELARALASQDPYAAADLRMDLRRALTRLCERERQALQLRHLDGMPVAACAALLGTGIDNTKKILKRALRKLRQDPGMAAYHGRPRASQEVHE
ncbi:sigma-70 family RNA polymerase sigma factor [Streptomyces sp. NBC_00988]|uniref:RNA polymerase sigma factor n=1 Tax=Streptomyces sp. NBC_00988 TaxID=2903704 RepID=UPI003870A00C|nr:sigma-70 family RNA polymerase sigma factor [Streptomyces sp. NBC_00988]